MVVTAPPSRSASRHTRGRCGIMKGFRIRTLVVLVAVIAGDCAVVQYLAHAPPDYGGRYGQKLVRVALCVLPMANVLAFGPARLLSGRAERPHALAGFVLA